MLNAHYYYYEILLKTEISVLELVEMSISVLCLMVL